jgi:hypothetical protein
MRISRDKHMYYNLLRTKLANKTKEHTLPNHGPKKMSSRFVYCKVSCFWAQGELCIVKCNAIIFRDFSESFSLNRSPREQAMQ